MRINENRPRISKLEKCFDKKEYIYVEVKESLLFLARKGCNVRVCVYVELFPH